MQLKLLFIFSLLLLISSASLNRTIRFWDDKMMQAHHHHKTNEQFAGSPSSIPFKTINVHLIPHTHDDVGWLKTLDEYYYGSSNSVQNAQVQYVLDTVVLELEMDPTKHFIYVEIAFFIRWWREQTPEKQASVKKLVANGQLEFINGGWCMNDEAGPYFEDIIDQMTLGHQFLKETFNVTVEIGWHIDPFGHSNTQASLFSQMGFNAFFFARIDYQDKDLRLHNKAMEMIWNPKQASGLDHSIFTSVNYYHYEAPPTFCFDQICNDQPIMDDPTLEEYNLDERAETFVNYFKNMALHYRHADLMHTMGSDFQYSNARKYFKNMDKLINHIKKHPEWGVNIFYSTPSKYIRAIQKENIPFPVKTDDFFPYADNEHAYWTGYFVSRITLKGISKSAGRFLQTIRTLFALSQINDGNSYTRLLRDAMQKKILGLEEAMAVLQHHDAVAGTAKQKVTDDYMLIISKALREARKVLFKYVTNKNNQNLNEELNYFMCEWNTTAKQCPGVYDALKDDQTILITVYNPGATRHEIIRIKVPGLNLNVLNSSNEQIPCDVICSEETNSNDCTLFFTSKLTNNAFTYFKIMQSEQDDSNSTNIIRGNTILFQYTDVEDALNRQLTKTFAFGNGKSLKISEDLFGFTYNDGEKAYPFRLSYKHYRSYAGPGQPSGAYIFRPDKYTINGSLLYSIPRFAEVFLGETVLQITVYADRTKTDVRIFRSDQVLENAIEVETFVDSIPIDDKAGKEVTINIRTGIQNEKEFYTDSNGLEMQRRILNYRETWELNVSEPVSGNYYPINAMISLNDSTTRLTVLNDRTQGGTSVHSGEIELMIHRRLLEDDWRGVGEPLNETESDGIGLTQRMFHYLVFSDVSETRSRNLQYVLDNAPIVILANGSLSEFLRTPQIKETSLNLNSFEVKHGLKVYLRDLGENMFLLRLFNYDATDSKRFTLNYDFEERSLSTTLSKEEMELNRLKWVSEKTKKEDVEIIDVENIVKSGNNDLEIKPLAIRSFYIQVSMPKRRN